MDNAGSYSSGGPNGNQRSTFLAEAYTEMIILPFTENALNHRSRIMQKANTLKDAGTCPTCENVETNDVYPSVRNQSFYEDDLVVCFLETYPRNAGHTIVLVKPHFEDVSELPPSVGAKVFEVIYRAIGCLKNVLNAEKVYMCTMCDGARNHLHFQLIPRLPGDDIEGSPLFVKKRGVLCEPDDVIRELRSMIQHQAL